MEHEREVNKLGKPIHRGEWFMTPYTLNAYYNPPMNETVLPAAILQPLFFNVEADDAVSATSGLAVAYSAYHHSLNEEEALVIDGLTGD